MTSPSQSPSLERLRLFSLLWAAANIVHQMRHPITDLTPLTHITGITGLLSLAVFTFAACAIVFPRDTRPLVLMAAAGVTLTTIKFPVVPNHDLIMLTVNLLIIIAWLSQRQWRTPREGAWFAGFEPVARLGFVIAYAAAALAKLNSSFFDPKVSCAPGLFATASGDTGLVDVVPPMVVIFLVAGAELTIPLSLLFHRTRRFGILLALVFHLILVVHPDAPGMGFTWVLYALVSLFMSQAAVEFSTRNLRQLRSRFTLRGVSVLPAALTLAFILIGVEVWVFYIQNFSMQLGWSLPLYTAALAVLFLGFAVVRGGNETLASPTFSFGKFPQALIVALIIANAAAPYLGGKTTTSFTMYSNLRTEGPNSNHFFIPRLPIHTAQDDLVDIISSSNRRLETYAERGIRLSHHELRRILSASPETSITYVRDGRTIVLERAADDPELTSTDWSHKFVHHRLVYPESTCSW